jgi:hypothetical protein
MKDELNRCGFSHHLSPVPGAASSTIAAAYSSTAGGESRLTALSASAGSAGRPRLAEALAAFRGNRRCSAVDRGIAGSTSRIRHQS